MFGPEYRSTLANGIDKFLISNQSEVMSMTGSIPVRDFLLDPRLVFPALGAFLAGMIQMLRVLTKVVKSFKDFLKEANGMPKINAFQGFKAAARKRAVILPLVLGLVLMALGGGLLLGHASVVDVGKPIGDVGAFSVDENYVPTGRMGDIGDVSVSKQPEFVRFTYQARGQGPHEWEYKFIQGRENPIPAGFGGVMYLDPQGNWGTDPDGGNDLRTCHRAIMWEGRSDADEVNVEFVIGGDKKQWDAKTNERVNLPYPNSISRSLGTRKLTTQWQTFNADLSKITDDRFKRIVGGFGWVIAWDSNDVRLNKEKTGAERPKTFTIEIRNVRYEK
jgi:hypothetical protein